MTAKESFRQAILYMIFGSLTSCIDLFLFYILKEAGYTATQEGYLLSNAIAFSSALVFCYITNRLWVFKSEGRGKKYIAIEALKFFISRVFSGAVEIFGPIPLSKVFIGGLTIHIGPKLFFIDGQWLAKGIVTVVAIIMNFAIGKFFVFNAVAPKEEEDKE